VHPTCYSYWLANSFSQFLPSGCLCIRGCSELVWSFELYCIIGLTCILHSPYCLQWVLVLAILSTSLSACVVIVLLHCIVYLHIPLSLQWVPVYISSPHPHVCLCLYFSCRKDNLFTYWSCVLLLAYRHWHWHLLLIICLLPQLLRAVAPAPTLINTF